MKKISILAIITLLFIAVEFVSAFVDLWGYKSLSGIVKQSTEVVGKSIDGDHRTFTIVQSLNMVPVEDKFGIGYLGEYVFGYTDSLWSRKGGRMRLAAYVDGLGQFPFFNRPAACHLGNR